LLVTSNGYLWQTNIIIENGRDVLLYCLLTTSYGRGSVMDKNEAMLVVWQALTSYSEDSIASDEESKQELNEAWQIIQEIVY